MDEKAAKIQQTVKQLFDEEKIDLFIGYEPGSIPLRSRPSFISKDDPDRDEKIKNITWDSFCTNNLAAFLTKFYEKDPHKKKKPGEEEHKPVIAVAVKGCDLRSVVTLVKEKQIPRDHLVLIGVPCMGMIDRNKVYDLVDPGDEIISHEEKDDGTLVIETRHGKKQELNREEYLREACLECRFPKPENTDYDTGGDAREPGDGGYDKIKAFEEKSREERWEYFKEEMTKCIRCSACRQACPTCYCKECFAEQLDLNWIGMTTELTDSMLFQLVRIFHQAGRCVECDACYDACPMNIDLRTLTKKMVKDVEELFDYLPDFNTETVPPLSTFKEGDPEEFITDPEKKE